MVSLILLVAIVSLIVLEQTSRFQFRRSRFFRPHFATDGIYLLFAFIAGGSIFSKYFEHAAKWVEAISPLPSISSIHLPSGVLIFLTLLLLDLGNYLCHYCLHRFDFLWEFHKIHHSSATLDWLATFRSHLLEQTLRRFLAPGLLIIFGFPLPPVIAAIAILLGWAVLNHSNLQIDLSILESILITPRLHRVHHLPEKSESNLGTIFTFWDFFRGTLSPVITNDKSRFGNGEPQYPQTWFPQLIEPLRSSAKRVLKFDDQFV